MGIISKARDAIRRHRNFNPQQAYLEQATSLVDLEYRLREIDRGKFTERRSQFY